MFFPLCWGRSSFSPVDFVNGKSGASYFTAVGYSNCQLNRVTSTVVAMFKNEALLQENLSNPYIYIYIWFICLLHYSGNSTSLKIILVDI